MAQPVSLPSAIYTDPPSDPAHPARMVVLHIPSGGVQINGVAYLAAGAGPHPTLVICHGLPGNEKNLDLAQAVRRAGWNAITFNYRGSWGSPGSFRFAQNPEDARAVLAFLRDPQNAAKLGVDAKHIAMVGHSMGGWVTALVGGQDYGLAGVGLISAANMGRERGQNRAQAAAFMADNMEALAGVTAESMAEEISANREAFDFTHQAKGLAAKPVLILTSNDGLAPQAEELARAIREAGGARVQVLHQATDHGWSDRRIALQAAVINWLQSLGSMAH
ncbi:MAG: alpha/beta hydrolase [Alphaproteobacteria bacterium PA2]|nr:MAG: alpha/beta hydrolase [Alphaproteobacteria bacterium PA2]